MTGATLVRINEERFALWKRRANLVGITPFLMLGVGHGLEGRAALGRLSLQITEDMDLKEVISALRVVLHDLEHRLTDAPA